jgi:hypothetical protein
MRRDYSCRARVCIEIWWSASCHGAPTSKGSASEVEQGVGQAERTIDKKSLLLASDEDLVHRKAYRVAMQGTLGALYRRWRRPAQSKKTAALVRAR